MYVRFFTFATEDEQYVVRSLIPYRYRPLSHLEQVCCRPAPPPSFPPRSSPPFQTPRSPPMESSLHSGAANNIAAHSVQSCVCQKSFLLLTLYGEWLHTCV